MLCPCKSGKEENMNDNLKILGAINARANVHEQEWNDYEETILITASKCVITDAFGEDEQECPLDKFQLDIPAYGENEYFIFSDGGITIDDAIGALNHADDSGMVTEEEFLTKFGLRHINQEWEELFSAMRAAALDPKRVKELLKL